MKHLNASHTINHLDPSKDYEQIVRLLINVIFPWDIERALEFALYRTYAIPAISGLLFATGEFTKSPRKRYDDTELLLSEIVENGFDSDAGKASIQRINDMHSHYSIHNDDFLYVLSTFIYEPIRWLDKFGWRALTQIEKQALFYYYIQLGKHMQIKNLPTHFDVFEKFNRDYEQQHFSYAQSNAVIAETTGDLFLGFYLPKPLWFLGKPFIYALLDKPLLDAFHFPQQSQLIRNLTKNLLVMRAKLLKILPKNSKEKPITAHKRPTYPMGYAIKNLGTFIDKERA